MLTALGSLVYKRAEMEGIFDVIGPMMYAESNSYQEDWNCKRIWNYAQANIEAGWKPSEIYMTYNLMSATKTGGKEVLKCVAGFAKYMNMAGMIGWPIDPWKMKNQTKRVEWGEWALSLIENTTAKDPGYRRCKAYCASSSDVKGQCCDANSTTKHGSCAGGYSAQVKCCGGAVCEA